MSELSKRDFVRACAQYLPADMQSYQQKYQVDDDLMEMHDFMYKRLSASLREWITVQWTKPKTVDDCIYMIEHWCESKATIEKSKPGIKC